MIVHRNKIANDRASCSQRVSVTVLLSHTCVPHKLRSPPYGCVFSQCRNLAASSYCLMALLMSFPWLARGIVLYMCDALAPPFLEFLARLSGRHHPRSSCPRWRSHLTCAGRRGHAWLPCARGHGSRHRARYFVSTNTVVTPKC